MQVSPKAPTFGAGAKNLFEPIYNAVMRRMRHCQLLGCGLSHHHGTQRTDLITQLTPVHNHVYSAMLE